MSRPPRPLPIKQFEVDQKFFELLKQSGVNQENIANRLEYKSSATFSRWFNWEEADRSPVFQMLRLLEACRDEQPGLDAQMLDLFNFFAEQVTGRQRRQQTDFRLTLDKIQDSASEMLSVFLNNLAYSEMLPMARAIKQNAAEMERALMGSGIEDTKEEAPRVMGASSRVNDSDAIY